MRIEEGGVGKPLLEVFSIVYPENMIAPSGTYLHVGDETTHPWPCLCCRLGMRHQESPGQVGTAAKESWAPTSDLLPASGGWGDRLKEGAMVTPKRLSSPLRFLAEPQL